MAQDKQDLENDLANETDEKGGGKSKKLLFIIIGVLVLGGGAGAYFFLGSGGAEAPVEGDVEEVVVKERAYYLGVPEGITANLTGEKRSRTVQIKMTFMVRGDSGVSNVKMHMPRLKNDVLMLVSQQSADEVKLPTGRQMLQEKSLETVQATMTDLVGDPTIEKVLFVSFVMQ